MDGRISRTMSITEDRVAGGWTERTLPEQLDFFSWMDRLCSEAQGRGLPTPWPISAYMSQALDYWIVDFDRGLTPAAALDNTPLGGRKVRGTLWIKGRPVQ